MRRFLLIIFSFFILVSFVYAGVSVTGNGGGGTQTSSNCNQAQYYPIGVLCQSTVDGKLYKGTGSGVLEVAAGASTGDFSGPGSSVLSNFVGFSDTGGKTGKDSGYSASSFDAAGAAAARQANLSLVAGTMTNGYICTYTASGTLLSCNTNPATFQASLGLVASTMTNGYLCTYTASGTLLACNTNPATFQTALTNPLVAGTLVNGDYCTKNSASNTIDCNSSGGSMVYPGAGIPVSVSGTSWGSSLALVTSVGNPGADTNIPSEKAIRTAISASGGGTIGGSSGSTDTAIIRANGTGGSTIESSLATIDSSGNINIPTGQKYKINGTALAYGDVGADASGAAAAITLSGLGGINLSSALAGYSSTPGTISTSTSLINAISYLDGNFHASIGAGADNRYGLNLLSNSASLTPQSGFSDMFGFIADVPYVHYGGADHQLQIEIAANTYDAYGAAAGVTPTTLSLVIGTNVAPATSGSSPLKANGTGGFSNSTYSDIVGLWTTCGSNFMKGDGSCSSGTGSFTGGTLTSNLTMMKGTTTVAPFTFQTPTALVTTPIAGTFEVNSDLSILYYNNAASTRKTVAFLDSTMTGSMASMTGLTSAQVPAALATVAASRTVAQNAEYVVCTGTCTITLPTPAAGMSVCARNQINGSYTITFAALGGSLYYEKPDHSGSGTMGSGTLAATAAITDSICLVAIDTTHWGIWGTPVGVWTAN